MTGSTARPAGGIAAEAARSDAGGSVANDAALAPALVVDSSLLPVVGGVADDDGEPLGLLEVGGALALGGDRILHGSELPLGGAVVERVGEKDLHRGVADAGVVEFEGDFEVGDGVGRQHVFKGVHRWQDALA